MSAFKESFGFMDGTTLPSKVSKNITFLDFRIERKDLVFAIRDALVCYKS